MRCAEAHFPPVDEAKRPVEIGSDRTGFRTHKKRSPSKNEGLLFIIQASFLPPSSVSCGRKGTIFLFPSLWDEKNTPFVPSIDILRLQRHAVLVSGEPAKLHQFTT